MFRLLVSGSREWDQEHVLQMMIAQFWVRYGDDLIVVHGDCPRGADRMAREFCERHGIKQEKYPADWKRHGKSAGPKRNQKMVDTKPDLGIFFFRGKSRGTSDCFSRAEKAGIPVVRYGDES